MRRAVVVVGALGLALVVVWWQIGMGRVRNELGLLSPPQSPLERIPRALASPIAAPQVVEDAGRMQAPASPALAAGADELWVEVVDATDGSPLAEAAVFLLWIDEAREREWKQEEKDFEDLLDEAEDDGESAETDEHGLARYPFRADQDAVIVARIDSRWGVGGVEANEAQSSPPLRVRIEVLEDFDLSVHVLDPLGEAAEDVRLTLSCEGENELVDELRLPGVQLNAETDSDGEAVFVHVGALLRDLPGREWKVRADVLTREPIQQELGRRFGPTPIVLHLPATGSVVLRLDDLDGEPAADGTYVYLAAPSLNCGDGTETEEGLARFTHVEVGLQLEAHASRRGSQRRVHSGLFDGPSHHGAEVEQSMSLDQGLTLLPLRIRSHDSSVDVRVVSDTGRFALQQGVEQGKDGLYLLELDQEPGETRIEVWLNAWDGEDVGARFELKLPLPLGRLPEREVVLERAPLLMAGRVVDAGAHPVVSKNTGGSWDGLELEYRVPGLHHQLHLRTDAQGGFKVRHFAPPDLIPVRVLRWNKGGDFVRVPVGSTDLLLVLEERE